MRTGNSVQVTGKFSKKLFVYRAYFEDKGCKNRTVLIFRKLLKKLNDQRKLPFLNFGI